MITTTQMCVKNDSLFLARLRLLYLILTSFVVGFPFIVFLYFPLLLFSPVFPITRKIADRVMQVGISLLMTIQFWLKGKNEIQLPLLSSGSGVLIVSNHRSHLDVFLLLAKIPGIRVLAKQTLFRIPILNLMMWASGQIPVPRGRLDAFFAAMKVVQNRLQEGERVHIFPEMTRCRKNFAGVQPFSAAPFAIALEEKIPILPIVFKDTDQLWPKGRAGISAGSVSVKSLPLVHTELFSSADQLRDEVQKQILMALT